MWRFLLPAVATMAVLIMVLGIALGNLRSLPDLPGQLVAVVRGATPGGMPKSTPPIPQAVAEQQAKRDALQRQVAELQRQSAELQDQLAQRSTELEGRSRDVAAARAESDRLQQSIDTLNGQQKSEEEALARLKAQEKQVATTAPLRRPVPHPAVPQNPASSSAQQLLTARQWLQAGRSDEARRVLAMVQTQMVLRPVTPDRPSAEGNNPSAADVGYAIRWLDIGATGQAMQAIDRAVSDVQTNGAPDRQWPSNSSVPRPPDGGPGMPTDYIGNGTH
jgi:hypothetical protein